MVNTCTKSRKNIIDSEPSDLHNLETIKEQSTQQFETCEELNQQLKYQTVNIFYIFNYLQNDVKNNLCDMKSKL